MKKHKILIVDDDREIVDLIALYLSGENYDILKANDGQACLEILDKNDVSLLVLDVMMPKLDGISVCKKVREHSNIPIILVTAKTEALEKVEGLSVGADDYITKPFHPLELVARIKAQMRRYTEFNANNNSDEIIIKDITINLSQHSVLKNEEEITLTPKEFDILVLLAKNRGQVMNSEIIFERVWKETAYEQENTVMVHIRKLREKLGDDARKPKYIHTVWGVGYRVEK